MTVKEILKKRGPRVNPGIRPGQTANGRIVPSAVITWRDCFRMPSHLQQEPKRSRVYLFTSVCKEDLFRAFTMMCTVCSGLFRGSCALDVGIALARRNFDLLHLVLEMRRTRAEIAAEYEIERRSPLSLSLSLMIWALGLVVG